ncbi:MAG TPA: metallophosphoesterase [Polyangia bacterium]|jgi:hypothetical protein|nr:metallophosphoesterase [Polyangia bacterium]
MAAFCVTVAVTTAVVLGSSHQAAAETAHLYPDPVCIAVGQKLQLGLTGAKFKGAGVWTDDTKIAKVSESGVLTGVKIGKTKVRVGGAAEKVTWGDADVTVMADMASCAAAYFATTPPAVVNAPNPSTLKFTFLSDSQGCDACSSDKNVVDHDFAGWFASQMVTTEKPLFILQGGDLANYGPKDDLWLKDMLPVIPTIPIYSAIGNHDLVHDALGYYKKPMQDAWPSLWRANYVDKGGRPWPVTGPAELSTQSLAYSFVYGNALLVVLDSYYMWGYDGMHKASEDHMELEQIDAKQLAWVAWLSNWARTDGAKAGVQHIFLISHAPLLTTLDDRENNKNLLQIISKNPMFDALLCGHEHKLDFKKIDGTSVYELIAGTANGETHDNSYLRLEVAGAGVKVTAVHQTDKGPVDGETVSWTK